MIVRIVRPGAGPPNPATGARRSGTSLSRPCISQSGAAPPRRAPRVAGGAPTGRGGAAGSRGPPPRASRCRRAARGRTCRRKFSVVSVHSSDTSRRPSTLGAAAAPRGRSPRGRGRTERTVRSNGRRESARAARACVDANCSRSPSDPTTMKSSSVCFCCGGLCVTTIWLCCPTSSQAPRPLPHPCVRVVLEPPVPAQRTGLSFASLWFAHVRSREASQHRSWALIGPRRARALGGSCRARALGRVLLSACRVDAAATTRTVRSSENTGAAAPRTLRDSGSSDDPPADRRPTTTYLRRGLFAYRSTPAAAPRLPRESSVDGSWRHRGCRADGPRTNREAIQRTAGERRDTPRRYENPRGDPYHFFSSFDSSRGFFVSKRMSVLRLAR